MPELLEVTTRGLVLVLYLGAAVIAIRGLTISRMWVRKVALITILVTAVGWAAFYLYLLGFDFHSAKSSSAVTMVSRILHYVTATGLYISASMIVIAERVNGDLRE